MSPTSTYEAAYTIEWLFNEVLNGQNLALLGAFLAAGFGGIGSAKGVGKVAQAADGLLTEDPDMFGKTLLMVALPGTQGIYGFITAFLVMIKIGLVGTPVALTAAQGGYLLIACLPVALVCYLSADYQARVAIAGINLIGKQKDAVGKAITNTAMVETYSILSLLVSLLMIVFYQV